MKTLDYFIGDKKPTWSPTLHVQGAPTGWKRIPLNPPNHLQVENPFYYVVDSFVDSETCARLIEQFLEQPCHAVGVDGYGRQSGSMEIGSYRANAWSTSLASQFSTQVRMILEQDLEFECLSGVFENCSHQSNLMPVPKVDYRFLGVTPYLRFMRYASGGKHTPHYDSPFINEQLKYVTLMSFVLYLNLPKGSGGAFQFIDDGQWGLVPEGRLTADWKRMASEQEILDSIYPNTGRLLLFPHWYPHQVQEFHADGDDFRFVIRGDVAYGW